MTDSENREIKSKVLGLKSGTNTVRQSFSHGRSKSVVVETRKKKLLISKKGPVIAEDEKNSEQHIFGKKKWQFGNRYRCNKNSTYTKETLFDTCS